MEHFDHCHVGIIKKIKVLLSTTDSWLNNTFRSKSTPKQLGIFSTFSAIECKIENGKRNKLNILCFLHFTDTLPELVRTNVSPESACHMRGW